MQPNHDILRIKRTASILACNNCVEQACAFTYNRYDKQCAMQLLLNQALNLAYVDYLDAMATYMLKTTYECLQVSTNALH